MPLASATQNEGQYPSDWLKWEQDNFYSRESITILAGSGAERALTSGMVLGMVTASAKYVQVDPDASDGSETVRGVLLLDVTAEDGVDATGVIICRDAIVSDNGLTWTSGYNTTTGAAALEALGIQVRSGA